MYNPNLEIDSSCETEKRVERGVNWPSDAGLRIFNEETGEFSNRRPLNDVEFRIIRDSKDYAPRWKNKNGRMPNLYRLDNPVCFSIIQDRRVFDDLWLFQTEKALCGIPGYIQDRYSLTANHVYAFLIDNCFPKDIWSVEYCLCDSTGERADSFRYMVDGLRYVSDNKYVLSA